MGREAPRQAGSAVLASGEVLESSPGGDAPSFVGAVSGVLASTVVPEGAGSIEALEQAAPAAPRTRKSPIEAEVFADTPSSYSFPGPSARSKAVGRPAACR
jgi:hypothetical protein